MMDKISKEKTKELLNSTDHMRGLHAETAVITELSHPAPTLLRFGARLETSGEDPAWQRANVAFRLLLEDEIGGMSRIYTVRDFDPQTMIMHVDVVLHGTSSPMMKWANAVKIGDTFSLLGPRPHFVIPEIAGRKIVVAADETAIPALYSLLSRLPENAEGIGWVSSRDRTVFAELPTSPNFSLNWVDANIDGNLADYLLALESPEEYVVWAAGERDDMKRIRNHFRREVGMGKDEVSVFGYWKNGMDNTEIDLNRMQAYAKVQAEGGSMEQLDDLEI